MKHAKIISVLSLGIAISLVSFTFAGPNSGTGTGPAGAGNPQDSSAPKPPDGAGNEANRPPRPPVEKIAADLGLSVDVVDAAFKKMPRPTPGERPTPAQHEANMKLLATELNVTVDKLEAVMEKYRPAGAPPRPPFDKIAKDLGVSTDKVRAAFAKLTHPAPGTPPDEATRNANRQILATELGVSVDKIDEVMDKYRPAPPNGAQGGQGGAAGNATTQSQGAHNGPPGRPYEKIAADLGVSVDKVKAAFTKITPAQPGTKPTEAQREANRKILSDELGVPVEKIDAVMDKYRPAPPQGGGGGQGGQQGNAGDSSRPHGPPVEKIAAGLNISVDKVKAAFAKVTPPANPAAPTEAEKEACLQTLAKELGVTVDQIRAAMAKNQPKGPQSNSQVRSTQNS